MFLVVGYRIDRSTMSVETLLPFALQSMRLPMSILSRYHLVSLLRERISQTPNHPALCYANSRDGHDISWSELGRRVEELALALITCGVGVQDKVAIFSRNMPEWTMIDLAILWCRGVGVPVYPTNTPKQAAYIVKDAGARILFVGEQEQFDAALAISDDYSELEHIVVFDNKVDLKGCDKASHLQEFVNSRGGRAERDKLQTRLDNVAMDDLLTLIYTSGTTGEPERCDAGLHQYGGWLSFPR